MEVYREFLQRFPNPKVLGKAPVARIRAVIAPLGLTKRAEILKELGKAISAGGDVPSEPSELERLPGIGPYSARSVAVFAARRDLPLVDWVIA
ncbi:MAG: A/G-specific adenine glycosylase, partial [Actinomycetota bacterium]